MKTSAVFYHAGCPMCVKAEHQIAETLDPARYDVEIVHLDEQKKHEWKLLKQPVLNQFQQS